MSTFSFDTEVFEWRGPSPFYFASVPSEICQEIKSAAQVLSYGWGVMPVSVEIDKVAFSTSLIPRQGDYLIPLRDSVRKPLGLSPCDVIGVSLTLG